MALRRIHDKPLSEPMLTRFTDACIYAALGRDELKIASPKDYHIDDFSLNTSTKHYDGHVDHISDNLSQKDTVLNSLKSTETW